MKKGIAIIMIAVLFMMIAYSLYDRVNFVNHKSGAFVTSLFPGHEDLEKCGESISVVFAEMNGATYVRCGPPFWPFYQQDVMAEDFAKNGFEMLRKQSTEYPEGVQP